MRSSKGLSAFCILHFALAILLSLAPGCGRKLAEVNVYITDEKTRLESEVLGKYQDLATEPLVIPSAKASSPPGAPALPLSGKAAQEALRQFQDNLAFLRKPGPMFAGRREQECATLYNIAALHSSLGQTAEALKSLGEAEQLADACQLFDLKWKILFEQALLRDADRLALLRKAVDALETAPQFMVKAAPANARLKGNLYQNVVLDLMAKNEVEPALAYAERFATQETVCLLAHEVLAFSDPNHAEFMAGFDEAKAKLLAAHARLAAATDATRPKAQKDFQAALKQYRDHIAKPPAEAAALAPLLRVTAPEAVEVLEYLPKDTCLVRYFLTPQKVVAWTLSAEGLRPAMVEAGRPFNETLGRLSANPLRYTADDLAVLSKTLVEPVAARLEKTARVYLVAEGKLSNVPWPELPCGKGRMIDRFQLGFAASLTHFAEASAKRSLFKRSFLACGEISNLKFQISNVTYLSGDAATTEAFLTKAGDHHVVHVNNPLVLRPDFPLESYVSFRAAGRQLGRLHAAEAFRLNAAGSLVTFASASLEGASSPSANSSAAGLLTTAFTFGGFPSILLADASDPELMASFYAALPKTSVGDALRQAQLDAAKKRPESKAWTRFRLYGHLGFGEEEGLEFADANYKDYLGKAAAAIKAKQWADVVRYCENALVLLDILDLAEHRDRLYGALVDACYNLKDYPKAIRYQAEVVKLAEQGKDVARLAEACRVLGVLQLRADDYKASVASLKRAVEIYQKNNLTEAAIDALAELGRAQESGTKYADALQSFRASLDMSREMKKERSAGDQLRRLGRVYYLRLSNYVEAEEYFRQALAVFQRLGDQKNVVETTLEIGLVHEKLADFREAAKYYQSGLELAQRGNDKLGQCKALIFLANTAWFQGDYHNAFKFTRASEALAKEIGSKPQQVIALNTLGLIFWTQNDYEASLKALDQALKLAAEIELKNEVASTHNNIGLVYREDKRYKEALDHFSQALALDTELDSKWGKAYDHRNMGMTYLRMGESDRALKALLESAQISQEIGEGTNLTKALFSIGDAYFEKGDLDNAVKHFGQALELAQRLNIRETEWRALRGMGRVHRARGNLTDAHDAFQKAIAVVEDMRAGIKVEEFRNGFLENKLDLYEDMVILLLDLGRVEDAFTYSERSRAKSFIDLLGNQRISLQNAADQKLYERQQALKNKIRGVEESVGQADGAARDKLHADLVKLRAEYRDLLIEIKAANPQLSSFVSVDVIKLPDLYALLSPDAALLEYLVARKEIVIWVVRKGDVQVFRIATDTDALRRKVMDYRQLIQNLSDLETKPKEFYDLLIKPVEPQLKGVKYLGIVPHGILHYLSFASLHDGTNYLVDDYSLFHSPSASVMQYTFRERKGPKNTRVLAIGNPDLGTATYDLPFAEKEVKSITWNFPQIDVLTREKATESWVVGNIGKYGIIHIASHGEFDPVSPLFSALKLRKDAGADGNLEVNEVTGLQTDADLVTLSACQTGLGKIESADEVIGLNRAFIYAGTRAILSSLWRVSDVSTAIMVKHFYRNYQEANKADSLRKAQLLVKRYYPHPSYWAGFVLTGDYR